MLSGCSEIPNNQLMVQFPILEDMLNVFADIGLAGLIDFRKLCLRQPHNFIGKANIHIHLSFSILIQDQFILFLCHTKYTFIL